MPTFDYSNATLGSTTTFTDSAGNPKSYDGVSTGDQWSWTGTTTNFTVFEANATASQFNGDDQINEYISDGRAVGEINEQSIDIGGTSYSAIYDYSFTVSDGTNSWTVAVIDVDLDNDYFIDSAGEDGYFLVFPDGAPPANTVLTVGAPFSNADFEPHADLMCFAASTQIDTPNGPRPVETLRQGDLVETLDDGPQALRLTVKRHLDAAHLAANPAHRPVRIPAGALGQGLPNADLMVSPQHRMLIRSRAAKRLFGNTENLVAAKHLIGVNGIDIADVTDVTYVHLLCDAHQILRANGAASETLFACANTLNMLPKAQHQELLSIFPELANYHADTHIPARPFLTGKQGRKLSDIHNRKNRPLLEQPRAA